MLTEPQRQEREWRQIEDRRRSRRVEDHRRSRISIGAMGSFPSDGEFPVTFLVQFQGPLGVFVQEASVASILSIRRGEMAFQFDGSEPVPYAELDLRVASMRWISGDYASIGFDPVRINVHRNVQLGNNWTANVALATLNVDTDIALSAETSLVLQLAVDILSIGMLNRWGRDSSFHFSPGGGLNVAFDWHERLRIVASAEAHLNFGADVQGVPTCIQDIPISGGTRQEVRPCSPSEANAETRWSGLGTVGQVGLDVSYRLFPFLDLWASGRYSFYRMEGQLRSEAVYTPSQVDYRDTWQLMMGVGAAW